jgi:hypothetical protein
MRYGYGGRWWKADGPYRSRQCAKPDINQFVVGSGAKFLELLVRWTI